MIEYKHLTVDSVVAIHEVVLASHDDGIGLRSRELLESAVAAPQARFGGKPIITNGIEIAASYLYYLCRNHPFVDGNKRVALACCLVFLQENTLLEVGTLDVDHWERLVLDVTSSELDRAQTVARLSILMRDHEAP